MTSMPNKDFPKVDGHSPMVSIVILNWNNARDTLECLESLGRLDYQNYHVTVVDNGSSDASIDAIRTHFPYIDLIPLPDNLGYAEGNNVGIRYALEQGADYILVLNNDTLVAPNMLSHLVTVAQSDTEIGMVGPKMYCQTPANTLFAAGSFIHWAKGETEHRGLFEPDHLYSRYTGPEPVDFIAGCGVLVSRELIQRIGPLDTSYYLNYEDVEWGVRATRHGFKVVYAPQAIMWHKISATLGPGSPANTYYMTRNALFFFWRNAPAHLRASSVVYILSRTLRTVASWTLRSNTSESAVVAEDLLRRRQVSLLAIRDFMLGRIGPMGADVLRGCHPGYGSSR